MPRALSSQGSGRAGCYGSHTNIESGRIRIERYIEDYIDSGKIAGCSMIVWRGGDELYTAFKGVQDLETLRPIARDTIFRVYSMTKPVASVALMMLFRQGAVRP